MTDKTREDFEAWAQREYRNATAYCQRDYEMGLEGYQAATQQSAARIEALEAERADFRDASKVNFENYEFQRRKADAATATVYQFHYAMKDAGWHPGRTDDNLCDIIRAKGAELAKLEAEVLALRKDAERLSEKAAIHDAINRACSELPEGYDLHIELEKNAGSVRLYLLDSDCDITDFGSDLTFVETINAAIDAAIEAERGEG